MKVYCLAQKCDAAVSDLLNATSLQAVQGISACCTTFALVPGGRQPAALIAALQRIPAAKLQHMQHGVLHAWTHHLAPAASARTFYQLLRGRAEFRDRR